MCNVVTDLVLMIVTFLFDLTLFFILQLVVFRSVRIVRIALTLNLMIAISAFATGCAAYPILGHLYSSSASHATGGVGAILSAVFLSGFYSFAGPICADRSLSAHIAILLSRAPNGCLSRNELHQRYIQNLVLGKRLKEHEDAGVISLEGDAIRITAKGRRIAEIYQKLIDALKLKENF